MDTRIFYFTSMLDSFRSGAIPFPIHAFLDITQECNQKCWYCYDLLAPSLGIQREKPPVRHMPLGTVNKVLVLLSEHKVKAIDICGGEPLIHPDITQIIENTVCHNIKFGLATNGSFYNRKLYELLTRYASWIRFSIDTINPELYRSTRDPKNKDHEIFQVIKNIKAIVKMRASFNRNGLRIGANAVIDRRHIPYLFDTATQCKEIGLDYLRFSFVSAGGEVQKRLYKDSTLRAIKEKMELLNRLIDDSFFIIPPSISQQLSPLNKYGKHFKQCYWSLMTTTIDVSGNVYTCPEMKFDRKYHVGNILEQPFEELMSSEKRIVAGNKIYQCGNCCKIETNNEIEDFLSQPKETLFFI